MNDYEGGAVTNLAETCVSSMSVGELLAIAGRGGDVLDELSGTRLSYGDIKGSPRLLAAIASLYKGTDPDKNVIVMNGGSAANFISLFTLVSPGDEVVSVTPTYQQLYSIPESLGANVKLLRMTEQGGFLPDLDELESMITPKTKLICLNNSNNPTGSLIDEAALRRIVAMAEKVGAWIHCDEVYKFMTHDSAEHVPSMCEIYDRAVVSCSLSKSFALAGLRTGWLVGPERFITDVFSHRDYMMISGGGIHDALSTIAVENKDKIFARNLAIVRKCAAILHKWVESEPRISYVRPRAGTTAFLHYDFDIPSEDLCKRLYEKDGTFLLPGKCFGDEYDRYLRIGYAYSPDVLEKGLGLVSDFMRDLERERA